MLGRLFQRRGGGQQRILGHAAGAQQIRHPGLTLGDGTGLVQHHRIHPAHQFQAGSGLYQNTLLRRLARSHSDGHRRGQAQSAGAGDHQHGDGDGQAEAHTHAAHRSPQDSRQQRDGNDHRHEHGTDLIRQTADRCLAAGGLLHQLNDLGQSGIRAYPVRRQLQIAAGEDGGGHRLAAHSLLHRHTLAGKGGLVHGAAARRHGAVHGDTPPLPDDDRLAGLDVLGGDGDLLAVPAHHGGLRRQRQQGGDGPGRLALGALLQVLTYRHQRQYHARRLEVQVRHTRDLSRRQQAHLDQAVHQPRRRAQRHQRVHIGRTFEQPGKSHGEITAVQNQYGHRQRQQHKGRQQGPRVHEHGHRQPHHVPHAQVKQRH